MSLIHIYWLGGKQRRIVCHHFANSHDWLAAAALPKPKHTPRKFRKKLPKAVPETALTPAQFEARRRQLHAQLQSAKNCAL